MKPLILIAALAAGPALGETVYVSDEEAHVVHLIDGATQTLVGRIAVGKRPRGLQLSADGKRLYVAVSEDNRIDVVDLASRTVVDHIPSGPDPETFALHPDGKRLFVANEDDALVSTVDMAGKVIVRETAVGAEPEGTTVSPDGKWALATSETASIIHFIEVATGEVVDNVMVDTRPRIVKYSPGGRTVWTTSETRGTVTVIDAASRKILKVIDIAAAAPQIEIVQAVGIEFTRDGRRAFVAIGRGSKVVEIDPNTYEIVRFFPVGFRAWNLALSPDETRLYTANGLSGDVSVIDLTANRPLATIKTGGKPWGVAARP